MSDRAASAVAADEWNDGRSDVVGLDLAVAAVDDSEYRDREARRLELAERKQQLAEQREARLATRDQRCAAPGRDELA